MRSEADSGFSCVTADVGDIADAGVMTISEATAAGIKTLSTSFSYVCLYWMVWPFASQPILKRFSREKAVGKTQALMPS